MEKYQSKLSIQETQAAIQFLRHKFETELCDALDLNRASAPMFVNVKSGLNDNLNGVERPVTFDVLETGEEMEIVHSLAKWKRYALHEYGIEVHKGIYTDMNAIRRDENATLSTPSTLTSGTGKRLSHVKTAQKNTSNRLFAISTAQSK